MGVVTVFLLFSTRGNPKRTTLLFSSLSYFHFASAGDRDCLKHDFDRELHRHGEALRAPRRCTRYDGALGPSTAVVYRCFVNVDVVMVTLLLLFPACCGLGTTFVISPSPRTLLDFPAESILRNVP